MKNLVYGIIIIYITILLAVPAHSGSLAPRESTDLRIVVRIIDYETTKSLCGADVPPSWCPGHLKRPIIKEEGKVVEVSSRAK